LTVQLTFGIVNNNAYGVILRKNFIYYHTMG